LHPVSLALDQLIHNQLEGPVRRDIEAPKGSEELVVARRRRVCRQEVAHR
jgi:hypothetical protein